MVAFAGIGMETVAFWEMLTVLLPAADAIADSDTTSSRTARATGTSFMNIMPLPGNYKNLVQVCGVPDRAIVAVREHQRMRALAVAR
jgi:hypothetical protein